MKEIERIKLNKIVKSQQRLSTIDTILGKANHGLYLVDATEANLLSIESFINEVSPYLIQLVSVYESLGTRIKVAMVYQEALFTSGEHRAEYLRDRGVLIETFDNISEAEQWLMS